MNWLDLAVLAIILLSAIFAFARGFVREALSIVAWVGAAFVTFKGFDWVYAQVEPLVHNTLLSQLIAGLGLFFGSLIVLTIMSGIVARMVRATGLSPVDRTLGFIFGLARGAVLVCLAYLLLDIAVPKDDRPSWIREAKVEPYIHEGADVMRGFLPESLKSKSAAAAEELIRKIDPKGAAAAAEELAKKASGALSNPTATPGPPPAAGAAPNPESAPGTATVPKPDSAPGRSYPPRDQRQLDRLIGTQR
jgi:membrane protein required for colicin V production